MQQIPHKCPVCDGTGKVPDLTDTASTKEKVCHGCHGTGIVWGYDMTPPPRSITPIPNPLTPWPPVVYRQDTAGNWLRLL